jgi:hypothetical protein
VTATAVHLVLATERRQVSVYAAGSSNVRAARATRTSGSDHAAHAEFTPDAARHLIDALAAATGYYPAAPDLDRQRETIRAAADELRQMREDADQDANKAGLVDLALHRHVGHLLADAAYMVRQCRDHMHERVVAEMASELSGLLDAIGPIPITNQDERIEDHLRRMQELREQLPQPGKAT